MKRFFVFIFSAVCVVSGLAQAPTFKQKPVDIVKQIEGSLSFPGYSEFYSVGDVKGKIAPAKAIYLPKPAFADEARVAGADGKVRVEIVIAPDGTVSSAKVVSGAAELSPAAENAALNSRFLPAAAEVTGHLTYEFVIRTPNWFLVAYDLDAISFSNPGVIRKAFPEDWAEERALATRLIELRKIQARRPVLGPVSRTQYPDRSTMTATVYIPPPPFELTTTASILIDKIRQRLSGDPKGLRLFELGEAFVQAQAAFRNPGMQALATGMLRQFVDESPQHLPAVFVERLRAFLAVERKLKPGDYREHLFKMAEDFRIYEGN